jgi:hypothetical protein
MPAGLDHLARHVRYGHYHRGRAWQSNTDHHGIAVNPAPDVGIRAGQRGTSRRLPRSPEMNGK